MNPQAEELNVILQDGHPNVYEMLSERGKRIFFPKKGILGQTAEAKGKRINATIGAAVEDDGSPMRLKSIEKNINISPEMAFPYAPSFGRPDIRVQWKKMIYQKNPALGNKEISLPVVTNALTHALSICGYMFSDEGSRIIIPDIYWGNYNLIFKNAYGVDFDLFNFFKGDSFDVEAFEKVICKGSNEKKVVLLNFPNNPTGYTPTVEEMKLIVAAIKKSADKGNKLVILIDDAYFGLVYKPGIEEQSIFTYLSDLHENVLAVKIDGPTKEDYVWGFRVGFITYGIKNGTATMYDALASKTAGAVRGNISNSANISQSLLLYAFQSETYSQEKAEKYEILKSRFEAVKNAVGNGQYSEYYQPVPFNSGYFMCVRLNAKYDGEKVRKQLLEKYDTGVINMAGLIRIAFSSVSADLIPELYENIAKACKDLG